MTHKQFVNDTEPSSTSPVSTDDNSDRPKRLPVLSVLLTPFAPEEAARRTTHVSLGTAFGLHILFALLTVGVILGLAVWSDTPIPFSLFDYVLRIGDTVGYLIDEAIRWPLEVTLVIVGVSVFVESSLLVLGVGMAPWGARDERSRASFAHGLRRTWLHTPHLMLLVLIIGSIGMLIERSSITYSRSFPGPQWQQPPPAPVAPDADPDSEEWTAYKAELADHQEIVRAQSERFSRGWQTWQEQRPWVQEHFDEIIAILIAAGLSWYLWMLLRGVAGPRVGSPIVRAPMCEACGYNLSVTPLDSRCPECGELVALSLGSEVRCGTKWDFRKPGEGARAWLATAKDVVVNPREFGRTLIVARLTNGHLSFFARCLIGIAVVSVTGICAIFLITEPVARANMDETTDMLMFASAAGCFIAIGMFLLASFAAWLIGLRYRISAKRNLMAGAIQMASYLGGYLLAWTIFATASGYVVCLLAETRYFRRANEIVRIDEDFLAFFTWFAPNFVWFLYYFVIVAKGTSVTRFANSDRSQAP